MAANHVGHGVFRFSDLPESVRRRIWNAADDTRLVGVAPRRDRNAPQTPDWVYINPHRDVLYLGYETICNEWSLIEPPNSHSLIAFLKRCWLHDINVPISVGYTSFEFDPTMPAVEIDVTRLAYINLERVTITSENVAPSIVEELDGYTDFKFVYHVKTNTVLVSQGTIPEDAIMAEHHQLRLSGDHIFKVEVLFDRQPDLLHDTTEWQAINNDETDASVFDKASEPLQFVWTFAAEYLLKRLVR